MPIARRRKVDRSRNQNLASSRKKSFPFTRFSQENNTDDEYDDGGDEDWNEEAEAAERVGSKEKKRGRRSTGDASHSDKLKSSPKSTPQSHKDSEESDDDSSASAKRLPPKQNKKTTKRSLSRPVKKESNHQTKRDKEKKKQQKVSRREDDTFDSYDDETSYSHQDDSQDDDFHASSSSSPDEDDVKGSEESEEFLRPQKKNSAKRVNNRKIAATNASTAARRSNRKKQSAVFPSDSEEEVEVLEKDCSSSEDFVPAKKKQMVQRKIPGRQATNAPPKKKVNKAAAARASRRTRAFAAKDNSSTSDEQDDCKLLVDSDESDFMDLPRRRGKAKKEAPGNRGSDSDESGLLPQPKQSQNKKRVGRTRRARVKVRDDDDDDDDSGSDNAKQRRKSTQETKRRVNHAKAVGMVGDADVGNADDSSSEDEGKSNKSKSARRNNQRAAPCVDSPPKLPKCPSTSDAITTEDLPPVHICYSTPDGSGRYCFALETLRQIALTSDHPKHNADGSLAFLQPLHFRSTLSDDLLDQIASRFGRDALDICGPYYSRKETSIDGILFNEEAGCANSASCYEENHFMERVTRFVGTIIGSRDLYVCPLCYTAAYKKMNEDDYAPSRRNSRTEDISKVYSLNFRYDPMTILGSLDRNEYAVAATFCFKSASRVKKHLLYDHDVDPKDVKGNDLYSRFAIRKQDGLLQRYIRVDSPSKVQLQGDLQRYWFSGNNFDFVHLVELVDKADSYRDVELAEDQYEAEEVEKAEDFLRPGQSFFDSFKSDAEELWELITGPYLQQDDGDVSDFLVTEEGSISGDEQDERVAHLEVDRHDMEDDSEEEELIERYRKMEEDDDDESDVDEEEEEEGSRSQESSEEEDEWIATKRQSLEARRSKSKSSAKKDIRHSRAARSSARSQETLSSSDESFGRNHQPVASAHAPRPFEDSEDEEPEPTRKRASLDRVGVKKRKSIIESDVE